jgi:hypothetical protein
MTHEEWQRANDEADHAMAGLVVAVVLAVVMGGITLAWWLL